MNTAENPQGFANKIIELINDFPKSIKQGKQAYEKALKNYSWREIGKKTLDFYKEIIKNPVFSSLRPIKIKTEPFWLSETIQKGRFKKNEIDQEKIYILGQGKIRSVKAKNFKIEI